MKKLAKKEKPIVNETEYSVIRFKGEELQRRLKKLVRFISNEETRYYLNGVYVKYSNGKLVLVATNGHLLQKQEFEIGAETEGRDFDFILPKFAVDQLLQGLEQDYVNHIDMQLIEDGKRVIFRTHDWDYTTKLIDGTFPDYKAVIPPPTVAVNTAFDPRYLDIVLSSFDDRPVSVYVEKAEIANSSPHLFLSNKEDGIICVLMPRRF